MTRLLDYPPREVGEEYKLLTDEQLVALDVVLGRVVGRHRIHACTARYVMIAIEERILLFDWVDGRYRLTDWQRERGSSCPVCPVVAAYLKEGGV